MTFRQQDVYHVGKSSRAHVIDRKANEPVDQSRDQEEIQTHIIVALSRVRATDVGNLEQEIASSNGCFEITSPEAMSVISKVQRKVGRQFVDRSDFKRENFKSLQALTALIERKLDGAP